jgi:chromosomal replication initiation ATPase DnaA
MEGAMVPRADLANLSRRARRTPPAVLPARAAEAAAALAFGIPLAGLRSPSRCSAPIAAARQAAIYLARVGFGIAYGDLGRAFGRDRTTAAHACRVTEDRREDPDFDRRLTVLETGLARWIAAFGGVR